MTRTRAAAGPRDLVIRKDGGLKPDTARSLLRSGLLVLAALGAAAPAAAQGAWRLGLTVSESWDTNVRLGTSTNGNFATRVSGRLSRNFQGPRSQLGLSLSGMKSFFHGRSSPRPSGIFYTAGAQLGYQLSERASLSLYESFKSSYTGELIDFLQQDEDVLLPQSGQKRNHLRASLSLQVSSLTTATISGIHDIALFNQAEVSQPRLTNGDRLAGGLGLSRKLDDKSAVNLGYSFARSDQRLTSAYIHGLSLSFSRVLGEFTNAGISIGGNRRETTTTTTHALTGAVSVTRQLEDFSVSLSYRRNLGALFGLGRDVVNNTMSLSGQRKLTRNLAMGASGGYSRNRDPLDPSFGYNAWFARVGLNLNLFRSLQLGGGYNFAKRSPLPGESGNRFQAHRLNLQLGWNTAF